MIIVTGGAGFIGSNLVAALEAAGAADIVICDRLLDGSKWRNIAKRLPRDIVRPEALLAYIEANAGAIETIFHLGANSATTATDGDEIVATNFALSVALWRLCARHGARNSSFFTYHAPRRRDHERMPPRAHRSDT